MRRYLLLLAALHGACGVAFAAIGAHTGVAASVTTGAQFQLFHAAAAFGALAAIRSRWTGAGVLVLLAGTLLFSGAVYLSGLAGVSLGPVAPTGGLLMIAGWLILAAAALRPDPPRP